MEKKTNYIQPNILVYDFSTEDYVLQITAGSPEGNPDDVAESKSRDNNYLPIVDTDDWDY